MNIKDVARLAGVGVSTVSRVINNHPDVKESTREKVNKIIKESNYIPNNSARILKQNNSMNIGVLVKGVFNPFFSEMLNLIANTINDTKYTMILQQSYGNFDEDIDTLRSFIKEKRLQGAICLGGNFECVTPEKMEALEVPVILTSVNTTVAKGRGLYSTVGIDTEKAAYKATKFLINLGHRDIAVMIGEENDLGMSYSRLKGYRKAIDEAGIQFDTQKLLVGEYSTKIAYQVMKRYLQEKKNYISAIFVTADTMALGVAKAIADSGLIIGKDISLVGFDGLDISEYYNPGITTIKQPRKDIALESVNLLLDILSKKGTHKNLILETELVKRESTVEHRDLQNNKNII